jgi:hypothetical protein
VDKKNQLRGCQVRLAGSASMDALPANRSWQPPCSHGTYQHETITSCSRQLLMMGTWLPETCWATSRREIKTTKVTPSWFFLSTLNYDAWSTTHQGYFFISIYIPTNSFYSDSLYYPPPPHLRSPKQDMLHLLTYYCPYNGFIRQSIVKWFSLSIVIVQYSFSLTGIL